MDKINRAVVEDCYFETVEEALGLSQSLLTAHKEGVTAAAMMLAAITGVEDEEAKRAVVALNLRPGQS